MYKYILLYITEAEYCSTTEEKSSVKSFLHRRMARISAQDIYTVIKKKYKRLMPRSTKEVKH